MEEPFVDLDFLLGKDIVKICIQYLTYTLVRLGGAGPKPQIICEKLNDINHGKLVIDNKELSSYKYGKLHGQSLCYCNGIPETTAEYKDGEIISYVSSDTKYEYKFGEYLNYFSTTRHTIKYNITGQFGHCSILIDGSVILNYEFQVEWKEDYCDPMIGRDPYCLIPWVNTVQLRNIGGWREIRYGTLQWNYFNKTHRVEYVNGAIKDGFYVYKKENLYNINVTYCNGQPHGNCIIEKDDIKYECSFSHGCLHGKLTIHKNNKLIVCENYVHGVLHGVCVYSNYKMCNYSYGLLHGDYSEYLNRKVHIRATYSRGKLNGYKELYHSNGMLHERIMYRDDVPIGIHEAFNAAGKLYLLGYYENGELVITRLWQDDKLRYEVIGPENGLKKHITYYAGIVSRTWYTYRGKQGPFRIFTDGFLQYSYMFEDNNLYGPAVEITSAGIVRCNFRKNKIFGTMEIGRDTIDVYDGLVFGSWTVSHLSYDNNTGIFTYNDITTMVGKNAVFHIDDILDAVNSLIHKTCPPY